ncbi:TfoX/Sxy family protein [Leeia aquatica]|uniref:TfoX/Sxy family protein n=1 Tax=Leeia aquatica TaxID=2725557 RepID=A0A847SFB1_9NEIS|nr:TfoX/Sxy family protein [Leeia aquatica]NLR75908.1 TfoX/Sxy family protein [Leeia aquatica]
MRTPSPNQAYAQELAARLLPLGPVRIKRFFGGYSLTLADVQFGFVMKGSLYFRVDRHSLGVYLQHGMPPFSYATAQRQVIVARYYEVPPSVLEQDHALQDWARTALAATP